MGTTFAVVAHGGDAGRLERAADAALDEARRIDGLLSNYLTDSEWSLVNRHAGTRPVRVSDELFALLERCLDYSRRSDGAFDITVGPLMKTWGFYRGEGSLPDAAAVDGARTDVGHGLVMLDARAKTVRFARRGVELDPGGIGKGYAVDRMRAVLQRHGVRMALISAGGSSIFGMGAPPDEPRGWPVTMRLPWSPTEAATTVHLMDRSLSTSGGSGKFFFAGGRRYAHILDPRTGFPAQGTAWVSVVAGEAIDGEAWTKPFFINGRAWTEAHAPPDLRVFLCEDGPMRSCSWIPRSG
jgi:thiamine biosynthesis lipoprotein